MSILGILTTEAKMQEQHDDLVQEGGTQEKIVRQNVIMRLFLLLCWKKSCIFLAVAIFISFSLIMMIRSDRDGEQLGTTTTIVQPVVTQTERRHPVNTTIQRRIVFSLTTSPKRIDKLEPTIISLLNQTVPADIIQLNLPRIFARNNVTFPTNLTLQYPILLNPHIRIVWSEDLGPVTKLVSTLHTETHPDTLIIIVDDDTIYPIQMLAMMKERLDSNPNYIQTNQCGDEHALTNKQEEFLTARFNKTPPSSPYKSDCCCRLHLGFGGVGYRRGLFNNPQLPFERYLSIAMSNPYCFRGDDFVVSNYLTLMGYQGLALRLKVSQQQNGFEPDALHKLQPRWYDEKGMERYSNCSRFLQRHNLSILRTPYDHI